MKTILLTQDKVALVDDKDYGWLKHLPWQFHNAGYATCSHLLMHRLIMKPERGWDVDHIDGNRLNNQRRNLRLATRQYNHWNRKKKPDSSSKYKGVSWSKKDKLWEAKINNNGTVIPLGWWHEEHHAAMAYDMWAHSLFGEFARPNFPGAIYKH